MPTMPAGVVACAGSCDFAGFLRFGTISIIIRQRIALKRDRRRRGLIVLLCGFGALMRKVAVDFKDRGPPTKNARMRRAPCAT